MYSASAVRHSRPTEKLTAPAGMSNASPPRVATATFCSAFVTLVALILMAFTAAADRFCPKMLATGGFPPLESSAAA